MALKRAESHIGAGTFSITTFSITTLSTKGLIETLSLNDIQHKDNQYIVLFVLSVVMQMSVVLFILISNVIMLNAVMLIVVAPSHLQCFSKYKTLYVFTFLAINKEHNQNQANQKVKSLPLKNK